MRHTRRSLRWCAGAALSVAFTACDSTPSDPDSTVPPSGGAQIVVTAPVLGAVPVTSAVTGQVYDAIAVAGGITWDDAKAAAEGLTAGECQGYLVSITSTEENDLIFASFPEVAPFIGNGYWLGAYQDPAATAPDLGWSWVSGEEFGGFTDWAVGVPDDGGIFADEDAAHFVASGGGTFGGSGADWNDLNRTEMALGYVVEFDGSCTGEELEELLIDVMLKRGDGPRSINRRSRGKIAVAVLSVADSGAGDGFDASAIDPTTVTLGDGSEPDVFVAANRHGKLMAHWPDLNDDGLRDALFHFNTWELVESGDVTDETTELVLRGQTTDGAAFTGSDEVVVK